MFSGSPIETYIDVEEEEQEGEEEGLISGNPTTVFENDEGATQVYDQSNSDSQPAIIPIALIGGIILLIIGYILMVMALVKTQTQWVRVILGICFFIPNPLGLILSFYVLFGAIP
jgi:hypothetical protein